MYPIASLAPYGVFRQFLNHVTVTVTVIIGVQDDGDPDYGIRCNVRGNMYLR
jgi:hypothetical protein